MREISGEEEEKKNTWLRLGEGKLWIRKNCAAVVAASAWYPAWRRILAPGC